MVKRLRVSALTGMRVNAVDRSCELYCLDDRRQKVEIHMPIPILRKAAAEATRGTLSYEAREKVGPLEKRGEFEELPISDLRNCAVATEPMRDPPAVILVIDKDTETQLAYRISPNAARQIGQQLVDQSERCMSPRAGRTNH